MSYIIMAWIRCICLLVSLIVVLPESVSAQRLLSQRQEDVEANLSYNECVYVVSNYSCLSSNSPEKLSLNELSQKQIEGFYFYLRRDTETNVLSLRNPDGSFSPFEEALTAIKKSLDENPLKIMTLFLDYYVDTELESAFRGSGLMDYVHEYDTKSGWPTLKEMINSGRRLVVFEVRPHLHSPSWLHPMNDFVEHTDSDWGNRSEGVELFDEKLKKSLSLFTGYKYLEASLGRDGDISAFARQTPYLIESFKRAWIRDGKIPNFILVNKYYSWLDVSLVTFRNFHIVYGMVTYNNDLLNYVNWAGMSNCTTGKFSFPLEPGAELRLSPICPGYKIEPATAYVTDTGRKVFAADFKAKPLRIDENIEVYLPFEGNEKDLSHNQNYTLSRGVEFIYDPIRGQVASFENQARVDLPTASELRMRDHDFTVGVWLKIPKYMPDKEDYCILGSKNSTYQQALHFLIRDRKPYMGFFNNDLVGNTVIEPGKWYNIVWRYNKSNGEQALFVNGKLDAISFDRPAYLGSDSLYVGFVDFSQTSSFEGVLDNLCIWSRVLSDKEILGLNNQLVDLSLSNVVDWRRLVGGVSLLVIVLLVIYAVYRKAGRRKASIEAIREEKPIVATEAEAVTVPPPAAVEVPEQIENTAVTHDYIRLFGEFLVLDREGNDITSLFTPRLKQLFILIMLHSSRGGSGLTGNDLTRMIWGSGESVKSTKSLRSVSILKLRKILERIDNVEIVFNANRYSLQLSNGVFCDYLVCLDLLKDKRVRDQRDFEYFYGIISKGEIFKGESFCWMDDAKSYICNSTVDVLSRFIGNYSIDREPEKIIQVADQILINDPCNEDALFYKIKALIRQNNFKLARYAYDRFSSLYQEMYGESFPIPFDEIAPNSKENSD